MVCGVPQQRQISIRRRGSFFEDPFFRDAWDDYRHAVRRIVDRFNNGWVNPSEQLHDHQYHSLYQTLRSARLNYSIHSARIKDEGSVYKLVMDVKEFIGGNITVRKTKGAITVKGKVEDSNDNCAKKVQEEGDDDKSSVSGRSTSTKTINRSFPLPPDADSEKIQSSLSKDAVLTVSIPKKSDVRFVPISMEGDEKKKEQPRKKTDAYRQPGKKRPSDTPVKHNTKKSQEERTTRKQGTERGKEQRDENEEKPSRRRSNKNDSGTKCTKFRDAFRNNAMNKDCDTQTKKQSNIHETKKDFDNNRTKNKTTKKDVCEVNIPVRMDDSEDEKKCVNTSALNGSLTHRVKNGQREQNITTKYPTVESDKKEVPLAKGTERRRSEGLLKEESKLFKKSLRRMSNPEVGCDQQTVKKSPGFLYKPELQRKREMIPIREDGTEKQSPSKDMDHKTTKPNRQRESKRKPEQILTPKMSENNDIFTAVDVKDQHAIPLTKTNKQTKEIRTECVANTGSTQFNGIDEIDSELKKVENNENGENEDDKIKAESSEKDTLRISDINIRESTSPTPQGSRLVEVEEDTSLREDGMFKDCWNDFSSTLHNVLSRLQELSSELGQSNATTVPVNEQSPSNQQLGSHSELQTAGADPLQPAESVSSSADEEVLGDSDRDVGGIWEVRGGTKDDRVPAHSSCTTGHDCSDVCNLDANRGVLKAEITMASGGLSPPLAGDCSDANHLRGGSEAPRRVSSAPRPASLSLRNVACPQGQGPTPGRIGSVSSVSRPTSLLVNNETTGGLLEQMRKNSPVEALQEDFFRRSQPTSPAEGKGRVVPVEVVDEGAFPVGGRSENKEMSATLSPSVSQSSLGLGTSGSGRLLSDSLVNCNPSDEERPVSNHETSSSDERRSSSDLNDLNLSFERQNSNGFCETTSNIDASPESNETVDSLPQKGWTVGEVLSTPPIADVTKPGGAANGWSPKISSDDAMGCEHPLVSSARVPVAGAKRESTRVSRTNPSRNPGNERDHAYRGREGTVGMGGVLSRGRSVPTRAGNEVTQDASVKKSASPSSASPLGVKERQQRSQEEVSVPPYLKKRTETPKRQAGFGHVNSDNVRRMRDVWSTRQDQNTPPPSPNKVPSSPGRTTPRRFSDVLGHKNEPAKKCEYTRPRSVPTSDNHRSVRSREQSPATKGPASSPSTPKFSSDRDYRNRISDKYSYKPPSSPSYDSATRNKSQGVRDKSNSLPTASPKAFKGFFHEDDLPAQSPGQRRGKTDFGHRRSHDNLGSGISSKPSTPFSLRDPPCRRSPPVEESTNASKIHHKIFKRLRDANLQPDSEAICFKEEEGKYKMVLDVEEFVPGEIEVLQDERVLTVKGRVETKSATGQTAVRTFHRTFDIPGNSKEEEIDSALSKDGILTIFVPKKRERIIKIELVD